MVSPAHSHRLIQTHRSIDSDWPVFVISLHRFRLAEFPAFATLTPIGWISSFRYIDSDWLIPSIVALYIGYGRLNPLSRCSSPVARLYTVVVISWSDECALYRGLSNLESENFLVDIQ